MASQHPVNTGSPIVKVEEIEFVESLMIGGEWREARFKKQVTWVRRHGSKIRLVHEGVVVDDVGAYNDFYSVKRSIEEALEEAMKAAKRFRVTKSSTLVVEMLLTAEDEPLIADPKGDSSFGRATYSSIPHGWRLPAAKPEDCALKRLELPQTVGWSTKMSDARSKAAIAAYEALLATPFQRPRPTA